MAGQRTNEAPGIRAVLRHQRVSAFKVRPVLDLIRGEDVIKAATILENCNRSSAELVAKALASAVANASMNEALDPEELYVASAYADEGTTMKRWRPRARGRATRIRKRVCHVTVVVARMDPERIRRLRSRQEAATSARRARRVRAAREAAAQKAVAGSGQSTEEVSQAASTADEVASEAREALVASEAPVAQASANEGEAPGAEAAAPADTSEIENSAPEESEDGTSEGFDESAEASQEEGED